MNNLNYFKKYSILTLVILFVFSVQVIPQGLKTDTVKSQKYDTGKMWTFEFPPIDYFKEIYGFNTTQEWFDDVRLSALRIPGCTASFVSEDGLIMTNNHCARGLRKLIEKEGENLAGTGFLALTLEEERQIPNYSAEQLVYIKDVTKDVFDAISKGKDEKEKTTLKDAKVKELKAEYEKQTGLKCDIINYYNGSIFFVQGFKVFTDVRLVFEPEEEIGYFGGDPDNFTFPRYNLDCTFMRIYENGKPLKTTNFFKWSDNGAKSGELVFTVGNPGSTNRLRTVAQLEYLRDIQYRNASYLADALYKRLEELKAENPKNAESYETLRLAFSNGQKSIGGTYRALNDPYLFARKRDFEKKLQDFVNSNPELKKEYGHVWKTIEYTRSELRTIDPVLAAFSVNPTYFSRYMVIANALVNFAKQNQLAEDKRDPSFKSDRYKDFIKNIYPANFDNLLEEAKLVINLDYIAMNLGNNNPIYKKYFGNSDSKTTAKQLISTSIFKNKETVDALFTKTPEEILALNDPFIKYYAENYDNNDKLKTRQKEILETESLTLALQGQALYKMYGTTITPDANRTLRISDGLLQGYNYNGTTAPVKTTFFGLYDRFNGFEQKYPFNLSERWKNVPEGFDLSTPFNFISTNDIVGGNSGSAIINKNAEVIGLAFDGNIESLQGNFIYLPDANRTVGVDSKGMYEAIKKVYKFDRLVDELKAGKIK